MKALYLATLALCIAAAMAATPRLWTCSLSAPTKFDCYTTFYDIMFKKKVVTKNFTNCVPDRDQYNPNAINCVEGTLNTRIICKDSPQPNWIQNCRVYKIVGSASENRVYNATSNCVPASPAFSEACACEKRPRIPGDPNCKDVLYHCSTQARLITTEACCFNMYALDPYQLICAVSSLDEVEV